jgi:hypothetical protein
MIEVRDNAISDGSDTRDNATPKAAVAGSARIAQSLGGRLSRRSRLYKAYYKAGSGFISAKMWFPLFVCSVPGRSLVAAQSP